MKQLVLFKLKIIMKVLPILFILLASISLQAQELELVSISDEERVLRGYINDQYPITIYLKVANRSDNVGYIYSVTGWYQYDNVGIPIPLVGVWNGSLHLFSSENETFMENLENFIYEGSERTQYIENFMYEMDSFTANIPEINERFHLSFDNPNFNGTWHNSENELSVSIRTRDSQIMKITNYLKLPNGEYFDLLNMGLPGRSNFEIEAVVNNGKHVLLDYSYHTNLNYNGRCGGATTSGKLALAFDETLALTKFENIEFVNCYRDLFVDEVVNVSDNIIEYHLMDYSASEEPVYIVDTETATIRLKE